MSSQHPGIYFSVLTCSWKVSNTEFRTIHLSLSVLPSFLNNLIPNNSDWMYVDYITNLRINSTTSYKFLQSESIFLKEVHMLDRRTETKG